MVKKIREEVFQVIGRHGRPTFDKLKQMKYINNVLNEVLRLYPIIPFNVRAALKDTTLPRGGGPDGMQPIAILKDDPIGYSPLFMQRRKDLFGPDADEFKPERWETWHPQPWTYVPFNGGPRICLGQNFALTEMQYVIARLFQEYEYVENRETREHVAMTTDIILCPEKGTYIALRKSKGE